MNSRYIGSDDSLKMLEGAAASVSAKAVESAAKGKEAVNQYYNTVVNNNQRLMELDMQKQQVLASKQPNTGIAAVANAGVQYLLNKQKTNQEYALEKQRLESATAIEQQKAEAEAAKEKRALDKEELEKLQQLQAAEAETEISDLTRVYLEGGFKGQGIESYKSEAIRKLSKYSLRAEDYRKLIGTINTTTETRAQLQHTETKEAAEKLRNAQADVAEAGLYRDLSPTFVTIKNLGVTDQAKPHLDYAEGILKGFLAADNGISYDKKLAIASRFIKTAADTYGIKYEAYVKYNKGLANFQQFADGYNRATLEYSNSGSADYNDLDKYKGKVAFLKMTYGDWSSDVAQLGEAEKLKLEAVNTVQQLEDVQRKAAETEGTELDLGDDTVKIIAVNSILNPSFEASLESTPIAKNPAVVTGIRIAKRYREYLADKAQTDVQLVRLTGDYTRLNLTRANTFSSFLGKFAEANKAGQPISPAMEQLRSDLMTALQQSDPTVAAFVYDKLYGEGKATVDPVALQKALDLEQEGITQVQNNIVDQQKQLQSALNYKYTDLAQYGLLVDENQVQGVGTQAQKAWETKLQAAQQLILQKTTQSTSPQYGVPPSFSGSSTYAPDVDASGRVRVAPRSALQVVNGIVTPVIKGANAPYSTNGGHMGGAYRAGRSGGRAHAGVDFELEGNEKAATLVSGVAYVRQAQGYGTIVDIVGDNSYLYRYAHQRPLVSDGQRVTRGQAISYSNGSGTNIGGNHLHFEVRDSSAIKFDSKGRYIPQYGISGTTDPIEHLRRLTANDSNVLKPRGGAQTIARTAPQYRVPSNAVLTPGGGAILNGMYSNAVVNPNTVGSVASLGLNAASTSGFRGGGKTPVIPPSKAKPASVPAERVYNQQKPLAKGQLDWSIGNPGFIKYDYNDDFGYAYFRQNNSVRKQLIDTAKRLNVPAHWIADIAYKESSLRHKLVHSTGKNFGLFGFGLDSFNGVGESALRNASPEQQIQLLERYMKENGWQQLLGKRGGKATIAEFWGILRFGVKLRKRVLADPVGTLNLRMSDVKGSVHTWKDELMQLGRYGGRRYSIPGVSRQSRNSAVSTAFVGSCSVCAELEKSGTWVAHQHENIA
jgi:Peptidase family M23